MWKMSQTINPVDNLLRAEINGKEIPPLVVDILRQRGYSSVDSMLDFLRPSLLDLHSPFLFKDMAKVIDRLALARDHQEKVLVYGDYDADGITGTALLYQVLLSFGFNVIIHIPSREEGYGLHASIIEKASNNDVKLIITVDCGITATEESLLARNKEIELIITDHHEPPEELPDAFAIINPKVDDCGYAFAQLAGVGVAFKVVQALYTHFRHILEPDALTEYDYLDLVALGTIADLVPLTGENRIFVKYGLKVMENSRHTGIRAMLKECGLQGKKLKAGQVSFIIAPRINAAGRMDTARLALNLFLEQDSQEALAIARELSRENQQRQQMEKAITDEAVEQIEKSPLPHVIVASSPSWHHGVIGIVASRLVERFQRPAFVIAEDGDTGKGSARGIPDYHVLNELHQQGHLLSKYGGHKQAAGFTLPVSNIDQLRTGLNSSVLGRDICFEPQYFVDTYVPWHMITLDLLHELEQLGPFGMGNPAPVIMSGGLKIEKVMTMGKNQEHLKLILSSDHVRHEAVSFKRGNEFEQLKKMDIIDIIYNLEINNYMDQERVQAVLKDYRRSETPAIRSFASNANGPNLDQAASGLNEAACATEDQTDVAGAVSACAEPMHLSRQKLADFYIGFKRLFQDRDLAVWSPDPDHAAEQLTIVKIFEELGLIHWAGGTNPFLLSLNKADKTQLEKSIRYRMLS